MLVGLGFAIDGTISFALAEAAEDIDPIAVQSLQALWDNDFLPIMLGVLAFLWATGISVIRSGALPKWLGWVMIVLGIAAVTPIGFVSFLGSAILVLVISVLLSLRARSHRADDHRRPRRGEKVMLRRAIPRAGGARPAARSGEAFRAGPRASRTRRTRRPGSGEPRRRTGSRRKSREPRRGTLGPELERRRVEVLPGVRQPDRRGHVGARRQREAVHAQLASQAPPGERDHRAQAQRLGDHRPQVGLLAASTSERRRREPPGGAEEGRRSRPAPSPWFRGGEQQGHELVAQLGVAHGLAVSKRAATSSERMSSRLARSGSARARDLDGKQLVNLARRRFSATSRVGPPEAPSEQEPQLKPRRGGLASRSASRARSRATRAGR